ncbi:MAG: hypothetical protein H0X24_22135 [Ktedonobacterales bacterium]|nr:hypothetical protein [Ktedonobacterales bacterium]
MQSSCDHHWQKDPDDFRFEQCVRCAAIRQVQGMCIACGGSGHDRPFQDGSGYPPAACGHCQSTGYVPLDPPRML